MQGHDGLLFRRTLKGAGTKCLSTSAQLEAALNGNPWEWPDSRKHAMEG